MQQIKPWTYLFHLHKLYNRDNCTKHVKRFSNEAARIVSGLSNRDDCKECVQLYLFIQIKTA